MKTVTRADLAEAAYNTSGLSRNECEGIVNETLEAMATALVAGEDVKISRFGVFERRRPPGDRMGRNPKNGVPAVIKPSTRVTFRAAAELKQYVNTGRRE